MYIRKILVKNYKSLKDVVIDLNPEVNIFVGNNDAGKSTILEVLSILTTGKLNGFAFDRQLKSTLFNNETRAEYLAEIKKENTPELPTIILEAYFDDEDPEYSGTNNDLGEDCSGIRVEVDMSAMNAATYQKMLEEKQVEDIPVELYSVTFSYFNGNGVAFRYAPFNSLFIDTTRKDYGNIVDRFVADSISNNLTEQEITDIATAYRYSRQQFHDHDLIQQLNKSVKGQVVIPGREISIDLKEESANDWKKQMSIIVDSIPFDSIGFGTQNSIKIELAMKNASQQANIVLMEEPENNLSYTNMTLLVKHILDSKGKQVFISTHSSYIANKLSLDNVILVNQGKVASYSELNDDTKKYFVKLPGYDTLRFILADKVILVEGPTDDLIIQKAYKDTYGNLPIEDGIDIIVVDSLAFKRYCDIALLMKKTVVIVTDNDGDIQTKIKEKYSDYLSCAELTFIYEKDETLNTIEPSVLAVNSSDGIISDNFKEVISSRGSMCKKSYQEVLSFMTNNKAEWAFRVFESDKEINYPEYIQDVVKQYH